MLRWIRGKCRRRRTASATREAGPEVVRRTAVVLPRPLRLCCGGLRPVTEPGRMRPRLAAWRDHRLTGAPATAVAPDAPLILGPSARPMGAAAGASPRRNVGPLCWPVDGDAAARRGPLVEEGG
ncbi:hypothetical protein [Streptomyces sp. NPDC059009]|uniref:hypothetical protein n=1 Tax=Streptomyces sp. NPDC059009 TaxID=3346694 RepID=UPI0036A74948